MAAVTAQAQDSELWRSVGDWDISIDPTLDNGCYALASWNGCTVLRIGKDPSREGNAFYVLIGNDTAEFWLKAKGGEYEVVDPTADEVDQLLSSLSELEGAVMIRNGKEYSAEKGASHLRMKFDKAGEGIRSAEEFIEQLASRSSMSGENYRIRLKDGTTTTTKEWLTEKLAELREASE